MQKCSLDTNGNNDVVSVIMVQMCFTTAFSFLLEKLVYIGMFAVLPKCLKDRKGTQM